MKKKVFITCLALLGVVLSSCSSPKKYDMEGEGRAAVTVTQAYAEAQGLGNWAKMCSLMTGSSQDAVQKSLKQKSGKKPTSCANAFSGATDKTKISLKQTAEKVKAQSATVGGDRALVKTQTLGGAKIVELLLEKGEWRVSLVPSKK